MARYPFWTKEEEAELRGYLKDGFSYEEIAELMGRTKMSVSNHAKQKGWGVKQNKKQNFPPNVQEKIDKVVEKKETPTTIVVSPAPVKEKTLKDFQPRDMIKYLYDMGYRIEDGKLVCLVKQVVNLKDIINA